MSLIVRVKICAPFFPIFDKPAPKYQVLLDNFRAIQGNCNIHLTALPLELIDFKAQCTPNEPVQLIWTTASELNLKNFEIQLSNNANPWQTIERIGSKGNATTDQSYQYLHHYANWNSSVLYYRLKINELDGSMSYSKVVSVMCDKRDNKVDFSIFPNPTNDAFTIQFHSNEVSKLEFRDVLGRLIWVQSVDNRSSMQINVQSLGLSTGIYFLKSNVQGGRIQKLIII